MTDGRTVLILGSAPDAVTASRWNKTDALSIVAINNAWRIRPDWDYLVHAGDFPEDRLPAETGSLQQIHTYTSYVPAQNRYGGFVYAGGTMAFTAGYWALDVLKPRVLAWFGCDMVYDGAPTHFYGNGSADPLRKDVTLRSLEAKSARLMAFAATRNCACVNLSRNARSRLIFPKVTMECLKGEVSLPRIDPGRFSEAVAMEQDHGYFVEDGEYWHHLDTFDPCVLAQIDELWLETCGISEARAAS